MPQEKERLLRELMDKYVKMYMKFAYSNGVLYDDVEDVVMDAFWSFYNSDMFGTVSESDAKKILTRIVKNKCIDYYRRKCRYEMDEPNEEVGELDLIHMRVEKDPLDEIIASEESFYIIQCIKEMKKIWREPSIMYFIEGRSPAEISEILKIPGTVCRSRISRAKAYLREKLEVFRKKA